MNRWLLLTAAIATAVLSGCESAGRPERDFHAALLVTDRPEQFVHEWETKEAADAPSLALASTATPGETVVGFVVFSGCRPGPFGKCDADVTFSVFKPDGALYSKPTSGALTSFEPPPAGHLQLGSASLSFHIEVTDPLGVYVIRADVRDRVSGETHRLEHKLEVKPKEGPVA